MDDLLKGLNPAQREAVLHTEGPLLMLAGPGSGKTRVVTHRIAHLLQQGIAARQILALTFTNKAAEEMRRRVAHLAPGQRVWLSTFHRFGASLLRDHADRVGLDQNYTIYDSSDARQTLKRVIEAERIPTLGYTPDRIASAISDAKNKLITADAYQARHGSLLGRVVEQVYPAYQKRLLASSAVDFDDLLLHVAKLLHDDADLRATLDERYQYVMVDEYQDTNRAQYVILRALSMDYPNLAATGDPDQSIYGWRGADLNNILEFEGDYPGVHVVRLEQNYRSTQSILAVADGLIRHNTRRKPKSLFTENAVGKPVKLITYADGEDEARGIAKAIRDAIASGERRYGDVAIFYRINALSRGIERILRQEQIPYQMVRGQEFYQRREIKDILAYAQLLNNPKDDLAFERTVNSPPRGIGKKTIERLVDHAARFGLSLLAAAREAAQIEGITKRTAGLVAKFVAMINKLEAYAHGPVEEAIGAIINESGYREHLVDSSSEEDLNRLANIEELLTDAREFDENAEEDEQALEASLEAYLERTWLVNETDSWDDETDKVTLMTLHAAKGLEFPMVFLIAVEDGILPHERSATDPDQLEEERRLAFVGITRAEQELQLSHVLRRDFRGQRRIAIPSSFLMELPRNEMDAGQAQAANSWELEGWEHEAEDTYCDAGPDDSLLFEEGALEDSADGAKAFDGATAFDGSKASGAKAFSEEKPTTTSSLTPDQVQTASSLAGHAPSNGPQKPQLATVSPDDFRLGMAVVHPEHGPGKVITLSGSGNGRRATVLFPLAGEKRFVLAFSPLRPAGKP